MQLSELLAGGAEKLEQAGIESAMVDAELLAAFVLKVSRGELQSMIFTNATLTDSQVESITTLLEKRAERVPLQHITGVAHFRNLTLAVGNGVFIPRPETEGVAELAINALRQVPETPVAVDLCTGSGAIAIAMATEVPQAEVFAWELNPASEQYLRKNIAANNAGVELVMGDIAAEHELFAELAGRVDVVVSNPPYIPNWAIPRDVEVHLHDPKLALYGGDDGMDVMRVVSRRALQLLKPGGFLVVEHADDQARIVADLLLSDGWRQVRSHQDLTGRDRSVTAVKAF